MRILIKATNFSLTPSLQEFIEKKIGGEISELLQQKFARSEYKNGGRDTVEARVEVARTTRHHKKGDVFRAEVTIPLPGKKTLRAEAEEWDAHVAIDRVRDELFLEISRWKEKARTKHRRGARTFKNNLKKI